MKGLIFTELVEWVEKDHSPALADAMIERSCVPSKGAYTSVGYYPSVEALELLIALSTLTSVPVPELARSYGHYLSSKLALRYPQFMVKHTNVTNFLHEVENKVHMEVRKLYPEAKPPTIIGQHTDDGFIITYSSHRPFAGVAHGLIEGFVEYFGEDWNVTQLSASDDGTQAEFRLASPDE